MSNRDSRTPRKRAAAAALRKRPRSRSDDSLRVCEEYPPRLSCEESIAASIARSPSVANPAPTTEPPFRAAPMLLTFCGSSNAAACPIQHDVVRLNVGGQIFLTQRDTLLGLHSKCKLDADAQSLFSSLLNPAAAIPVDMDSTGAILLDRDPEVFAIILSYLRGYDHALLAATPAVREMVTLDAEYYKLCGLSTRLRKMSCPSPKFPLLFETGPGVSPEGTKLRPSYAINFVGEQFLMCGHHSITFEVLRADYLGVGVASDACVGMDVEFHKTLNCCVYYMTGVFYSCFPSQRKEELQVKFNAGDLVTLNLDMDSRLLEFVIRDTTKLISVKSASRLRFAVAARNHSAIKIVSLSSSS